MQFRYVAEYIELLPNRETHSYVTDIKIQETEARRTTGFCYEVFVPKDDKWYVISEDQYYDLLIKHKTKKTIIRRKANKEVVEKENYPYISHLILTTHFKERLLERHINDVDATQSVLNYLVENGYYLNIEHGLDGNKFYLYEPDMRMLAVAALQDKCIVLITTYEPNSNWFLNWLKKGKLKEQYTIKQFIDYM